MTAGALDQSVLTWLGQQAVPAALAMARIATCYAWLPYLSAGTVSSRMTRAVVSLVSVVGLWPVLQVSQLPTGWAQLVWTVGQEAFIGLAVGMAVSLPFHIFHAFGAIVDNQRGASISAALDPLSGIEATETANLLQQFCVMLFLLGGGLVQMLEVLQASYQLLPLGQPAWPSLPQIHQFMDILLGAAVRMSLPVLLLLLLVEVLLGVLSRFAQQMNAFSVALTVKSFLAFLALLVYLVPTLAQQAPQWFQAIDGLQLLMRAPHEN